MRPHTLILLLIVFPLLATGCSILRTPGAPESAPVTTIRGGLYSHTIQPLTVNREPTEVQKAMKEGKGRITQIDYPVTAGLSIRVGKNGLGQVAKEHGITTIYYADLEQWSAVFGLWSMEVVHIYGQ